MGRRSDKEPLPRRLRTAHPREHGGGFEVGGPISNRIRTQDPAGQAGGDSSGYAERDSSNNDRYRNP